MFYYHRKVASKVVVEIEERYNLSHS